MLLYFQRSGRTGGGTEASCNALIPNFQLLFPPGVVFGGVEHPIVIANGVAGQCGLSCTGEHRQLCCAEAGFGLRGDDHRQSCQICLVLHQKVIGGDAAHGVDAGDFTLAALPHDFKIGGHLGCPISYLVNSHGACVIGNIHDNPELLKGGVE